PLGPLHVRRELQDALAVDVLGQAHWRLKLVSTIVALRAILPHYICKLAGIRQTDGSKVTKKR
ncbi:MAG TPA: hypothetical protein VIQ39_00595, partial [Methyloceanibacter sp.]